MLLLGPVIAAALGLQSLISGRADDAMYLFLTGAGVLLLTIALTQPCRYTIMKDSISVRCGVTVYQVSLDEIISIRPSSSWISAPALSLRRIEIKTKKRVIIVSPRDREAFIADLQNAIDDFRK